MALGVTVAYSIITDFKGALASFIKGALASFLASSPLELAKTLQPTSCTLPMDRCGTYVIGAFAVTVAYIVITDFKGALASFLASSPSELAETMQPTSRTLTVGPGGVRG